MCQLAQPGESQLTLFGQRVVDIEVLLVELQEFHCCFQSIMGLVPLVWHSINGNLHKEVQNFVR